MLAFIMANDDKWYFIVVWQFLQFGTSATFQILYVAHSSVFPTLFSSTSFGILNFVSRFATALAPIVSNIEEPLPMITFTACALVCSLSVLLLRTQQQDLQKSLATN